jgi:hypothetical protein
MAHHQTVTTVSVALGIGPWEHRSALNPSSRGHGTRPLFMSDQAAYIQMQTRYPSMWPHVHHCQWRLSLT